MGWANCGEDSEGRPIGYAVHAICDEPGCLEEIHRGLAYACGGMHGTEDTKGNECCEKYYCDEHGGGFRCSRCSRDCEECLGFVDSLGLCGDDPEHKTGWDQCSACKGDGILIDVEGHPDCHRCETKGIVPEFCRLHGRKGCNCRRCFHCSKKGCSPQEHAGWNPNEEGHG